jgi:hypothetical protein
MSQKEKFATIIMEKSKYRPIRKQEHFRLFYLIAVANSLCYEETILHTTS